MDADTTGTTGTNDTATPAADDRKIVGAVTLGGRTYKAGDEQKLHIAMQGRSFDRLLSKGVVSGTWDGAPVAASEADREAMASAEAAATQRAERVGERTARRTQQLAKRAKSKAVKKAAKTRKSGTAGSAKKGR